MKNKLKAYRTDEESVTYALRAVRAKEREQGLDYIVSAEDLLTDLCTTLQFLYVGFFFVDDKKILIELDNGQHFVFQVIGVENERNDKETVDSLGKKVSEGSPSPQDILADIKTMLCGIYVTTFCDNGTALKLRFNNGRTFRITVTETDD